MKKNILFLLLLTASAATLFTSCEAEADVSISKKPTTPSGVVCATAISGQLTETGSGLPIENALVTLQSGGATVNTGTVRTDAKGTYRFSSIPCGDQYRVLATKTNYSIGEAPVTANGSDILIGDIQMTPNCFTILPSSLDFGYAETQLSSIVKYQCEGKIDFSTVSDRPDWVTLITSGGTLSSGQQASVIVRVERSKLPSAVNNAIVTVNSSRGSHAIRITAFK